MGVYSILAYLVWQNVISTSTVDVKLPITHLLGVATPVPPQLDLITTDLPNLYNGCLPKAAGVNNFEFSSPLLVSSTSRTLPKPKINKVPLASDETIFREPITLYPYLTSKTYNLDNIFGNIQIPKIQSPSVIPSSLKNSMDLPSQLPEYPHCRDPALYDCTAIISDACPADYIENVLPNTILNKTPFYEMRLPCESNIPTHCDICDIRSGSEINSTPLPPVLITGSPTTISKPFVPTIHITKTFDYTSSVPERKFFKTYINCDDAKINPSSNPREYIKHICDSLRKIINPLDDVFLSVSTQPINFAEEITRSIESLKHNNSREVEWPPFTPIIIGETITPIRHSSVILQKSRSPTISFLNSSPQSSFPPSTSKYIPSVNDIYSKISKDISSSFSSYLKTVSDVNSKLPCLPPISPYTTPTLIQSNTACVNFPPLNSINLIPVLQRNINNEQYLSSSKFSNLRCPSYLPPLTGQVLLTPISLKHYCSPRLSPSFLPSPTIPPYYSHLTINADNAPIRESEDKTNDLETFFNLILLSDIFDGEEMEYDTLRSLLASLKD